MDLKKNFTKKKMIYMLTILLMLVLLPLIRASSDDMDVEACNEEVGAQTLCYSITYWNDGGTGDTAGRIVQDGVINVGMDDVSGLGVGNSIDLVNISIYHSGDVGITKEWTITLESNSGTQYCQNTVIAHREAGGWDYWDATNCRSWTKAELDDLNVTFLNNDVGGGDTAYIYEFDINVSYSDADLVYPIFSSYSDNNGSLEGSGTGLFNVTVLNSNGTVWLEIDGNNVSAENYSLTGYNSSYTFTTNGTYPYRWHSWGNGTQKNYNKSTEQSYTVNYSDTVFPVFSSYWDDNGSIVGSGTGHFNVSIANTNGTVGLTFDGSNYSATYNSESITNRFVNLSTHPTHYANWGSNVINTKDFTICVWGSVSGAGGGSNNRNILFMQRDSLTVNSANVIQIIPDQSSNRARLLTRGTSETIDLAEYWWDGGSLTYGEWHHFCGTRNSTNLVIYIDGLAKNSTTSTYEDLNVSIDYRDLGRGYSNQLNDKLNGTIDEVRVYNRSLTPSEILQINNSGRISNSSLTTTGLITWINFEEGSGTLLEDAHDGSDNATLNNVSAWNSTGSGSPYYNSSVSIASSGTYNYYWWAYGDGLDGNINTTAVQSYTVNSSGGDDTSFTISMPSGTTYGNYNTSTKNNAYVSATNQTANAPLFNVTNTGNVNLNVSINLNQTLPSSIVLIADTDNNYLGGKIISTSTVIMNSSLSPSSTVGLWFWSNFTNAKNQTIWRNLSIVSNKTSS